MAARPAGAAPDSAAVVYWRRRGAALLVSLSVLGVVSWGAAGVLGITARADRLGDRPARSVPVTLGSGSIGSSARLIDPALRGVPDATAAARAPAGRPASPAAHAALRSCPAAGVGLQLSATAPRYAVGQLAEFAVDVTSTAGYSCLFDIGAGHVQLQISAGAGRIWTSAECAEGAVTQFVTLQPGMPTVVAMTWNEQYSSVGCPMPGQLAPAGRYTATATAGSAVSNSVTFLIG